MESSEEQVPGEGPQNVGVCGVKTSLHQQHSETQPKTSSLEVNSMIEIWELCVLASRSHSNTTNAELAKQIASSVQDSLQKFANQQLTPKERPYLSREKAKEALAARKRKYQADKAFKEMDVVYGPLKEELAAYEREKGMTSNTGTRTVLETFEKRLKEAAKKAEEIGKKRMLEDTDDSGSDRERAKTPPLSVPKARKTPIRKPIVGVVKPQVRSRKKLASQNAIGSDDDDWESGCNGPQIIATKQSKTAKENCVPITIKNLTWAKSGV